MENSKKKSQNDIQNANDAISMLEEKLKDFTEKKNKIDYLQQNVDYYHNEIEKLKKEINGEN